MKKDLILPTPLPTASRDTVNRRQFGNFLLSGAATASLVSKVSQADAARVASDMPYRVFPDLKVLRNDKIRAGGDYWIEVGSEGMTSTASLNYFRRLNVRHLSAKGPADLARPASARYPHYSGSFDSNGPSFLEADGDWDLHRLELMQENCRRADMVLEGVRMDSVYIVMQEGPEREQYLDIIRENLRKASKAGIALVSYHWTMIPIRRNLTLPGRGGSSYTGFELEANYKDLPATAPAGRVSLEDYWSRIDYFLRNVVPVARECRIRLACHPYDPGGVPLGYQGVDNYDALDFVAAMKKYELLYDDVYNSFTYDCGVGAESMDDPNAQLALVRYLAERGKIAQVHFRNIRGHRDAFIETYIDEGDVNMLDIVRVLRDTDWEGSLLPDHVPNSHDPDDPHKLQSFAFAFGYIQGILRAAKEEAIKATKT